MYDELTEEEIEAGEGQNWLDQIEEWEEMKGTKAETMEEYGEVKFTYMEERLAEDAFALEMAMEDAMQGLFDAEEAFEHVVERMSSAGEELTIANTKLSTAEWDLQNVNSNEEWETAMAAYEIAAQKQMEAQMEFDDASFEEEEA